MVYHMLVLPFFFSPLKENINRDVTALDFILYFDSRAKNQIALSPRSGTLLLTMTAYSQHLCRQAYRFVFFCFDFKK